MKKSKAKQVPEPLGTIMGRAAMVDLMPLPYRVPFVNPAKVHEAAKAHAQWHNSDPFAYSRMFLHLRRGLDLVSDVLKEAQSGLRAREARKGGE